jgi:hypothetical protein
MKKPSIVQKQMLPHMKALVIFIEKKKIEEPNNQKKCHFQAPSLLNIFAKISGIDHWVN